MYRSITSELVVVSTLILAWFQLKDIAQVDTITAEKYIVTYEEKYFDKWGDVDDHVAEIKKEFEEKHGTIHQSDNEEKKKNHLAKFDEAIIDRILVDEGELRGDVNKIANHFRSAIFCVKDGGRCNEKRVIDYYKRDICSFVQKTYGYLNYMYDKEKRWKRNRGDLIAFNAKHNCKDVDREVDSELARADTISAKLQNVVFQIIPSAISEWGT